MGAARRAGSTVGLVRVDVEAGGVQLDLDSSARASASSSTTAPRAVLTSTAVGFMAGQLGFSDEVVGGRT